MNLNIFYWIPIIVMGSIYVLKFFNELNKANLNE